jgi:1-acyl-sn-glycerol-3-phosphate acyltransferase
MLDMDVVRHAPLTDGPKIIAANHPTTIDPFLMLTLVPEQMSILVTGICFKMPVFGRYLWLAGHVPVVSGNGRAAFDEAKRLLQAGRTIGIFPEGTLSPLEGGLGFHGPRTGAVRLSLSTGAPIVPVGIHLQRERIRFIEGQAGSEIGVARWYSHGPYAVTVGKPMRLEGDAEDREHVRLVSARIMQRIIRLSQESAHRVQGAQALGTGSLARPVGSASVS